MTDREGEVPELWEGMLDLYAAPGVAAACIAVQDSCDADVLLLLSAALLARDGLRLPPALARRMAAQTREWRVEVVLPLRALRRRWRDRLSAQALRERIKSLELDAERSEVETLQSLLDEALPLPRDEPGAALLRDNCEILCLDPGRQDTACINALASFLDSAAAVMWRESAG